jgi:hypothetical protein
MVMIKAYFFIFVNPENHVQAIHFIVTVITFS